MDINKAKYKNETILLVFSVISVITLLYFFYDFNPYISIAVTIGTLIYIRLLQGQYLGNSLQVTNKHFFRLKQILEDQSIKLGVKEPSMFILQDPNPNAFTIGFRHPYSIVLNSSLIENLDEDELEAVIAHEMGHVKFHHSRVSSIISPAGQNIPIFSWIFGFWQRTSELTADRVSLLITENPRSLITALIKISVGPKFLDQIDEEELLKQSQKIKGNYFNKWGELLNNHPYLTTRINGILKLSKEVGIPYYKGGKYYCINCGSHIVVSAKFCPKCGFQLRKTI